MPSESSPVPSDAGPGDGALEDVEAVAPGACEASLEDLISEEGDSGEEEPVFVEEKEAGGGERASAWQIDHSFGEYQFNGTRCVGRRN